ncbi:hypothetical protein [Pseudoduganella sp. OTU4001]|uniref:hypothetical protein n=1 Tax=Pseudoduganella sp. OTU4001 TaxID=3043854 RepID=UPI00313EE4E4
MSQIIHELATIEISNESMKQLDLAGIYRSFSENYKRLDEFKEFRSEYEQKNWLTRWWHNDKLRDAQMESTEVQAEFSKTIGQLMLISIMQSKKLQEQQGQLNEQQKRLKEQADGIAEQAAILQAQHHTLAEQSAQLKKLVEEYFELKGLTDEGAQKLIEIAKEIKATKDSMVQHVDERTRTLERQGLNTTTLVHALEKELREHSQSSKAALQENETRHASRSAALESGLSQLASQLQLQAEEHQTDINKLTEGLHAGLSSLAQRSRRTSVGLSLAVFGALLGMLHLYGVI